jgi:hypothetical protein
MVGHGPLNMVREHARLNWSLGIVKGSPGRDSTGLGTAETVWTCVLRSVQVRGGVVHDCSGIDPTGLIG